MASAPILRRRDASCYRVASSGYVVSCSCLSLYAAIGTELIQMTDAPEQPDMLMLSTRSAVPARQSTTDLLQDRLTVDSPQQAIALPSGSDIIRKHSTPPQVKYQPEPAGAPYSPLPRLTNYDAMPVPRYLLSAFSFLAFTEVQTTAKTT